MCLGETYRFYTIDIIKEIPNREIPYFIRGYIADCGDKVEVPSNYLTHMQKAMNRWTQQKLITKLYGTLAFELTQRCYTTFQNELMQIKKYRINIKIRNICDT